MFNRLYLFCLYRAVIARLAEARFAVFYRRRGAIAYAGHAVCAVPSPYGAAVLKADAVRRALACALAAADALRLVNDRVLILHTNRAHRTVVIAGTRKTSAAVVRNEILAVGASGTPCTARGNGFVRALLLRKRIVQIFFQRLALVRFRLIRCTEKLSLIHI